MDLANLSALWFPIQCFSDAIMKGWYDANGININVGTNPFFAKVLCTNPDGESVAKAKDLAADRPNGEVGIVVVAKENHLQIISEEFTDAYGKKHILPVIWNARLVQYPEKIKEDEVFYSIYCDTVEHNAVGGACAVYDRGQSILWCEEDAKKFRWNKPLRA